MPAFFCFPLSQILAKEKFQSPKIQPHFKLKENHSDRFLDEEELTDKYSLTHIHLSTLRLRF